MSTLKTGGTAPQKQVFTLRLEPELVKQIEMIAAERDHTLSKVAATLIREALIAQAKRKARK